MVTMTDEEFAEKIAFWMAAARHEAREECAKICDEVQKEGDDRAHASADPAEGSDGAAVAAERIRALINEDAARVSTGAGK